MLEFRGHGGAREGAGRKPASARSPVHHVKRPKVPRGSPAHVTLRVRLGVPSLRSRHFIREFQTAGFDARVWELVLFSVGHFGPYTVRRPG